MSKGPKGQKRPADAIGTAVKVAKTATDEIQEDMPDEEKASAVRSLDLLGGKARAASINNVCRVEIARKAAKECWKKGC